MSCTLSCPAEIDFEFPPATAYTCDFATGKFTPAKVPKCVYGKNLLMIKFLWIMSSLLIGDGVQVVQRSQNEVGPEKITSRGREFQFKIKSENDTT